MTEILVSDGGSCNLSNSRNLINLIKDFQNYYYLLLLCSFFLSPDDGSDNLSNLSNYAFFNSTIIIIIIKRRIQLTQCSIFFLHTVLFQISKISFCKPLSKTTQNSDIASARRLQLQLNKKLQIST